MKNLQNLSENELRSINGGGLFGDLASSVSGIVSNAIDKQWADMASSIVQTATTGVKIIGSFFSRFK